MNDNDILIWIMRIESLIEPQSFILTVLALGITYITLQFAFFIVKNRFEATRKMVLAAFGRNSSDSIKPDLDVLFDLASFCAALMIAGFLAIFAGSLFYAHVIWYPPLDTEKSFSEWFSVIYSEEYRIVSENTQCGFWHSWKGLPERIFNLMRTLGGAPPQAISNYLNYKCSDTFQLYSAGMGFLTSTIITATGLFAVKTLVSASWRVLKRAFM